jgi:sugar phosphate isomerase/epimerase
MAASPILLNAHPAAADTPESGSQTNPNPGGNGNNAPADSDTTVRLKLGLNAFTFNTALKSGDMTRNDVIDFCCRHKIDGVDMTGYYFSQYPGVPDDDSIYQFKRYAFENGVTVSGTGIRNNFSISDPGQLALEVKNVKDWVVATAKMGADVLRVYSGRPVADPEARKSTFDRMVAALKECTQWASQHGVMLGLQPHHDFLKTADQTINLLNAVDDTWLQVVLDIGSLRTYPVYDEIEKLMPYAVTWQLKEQVWIDDAPVPVDLGRIKAIIQKVGYRGFLPLELLGPFTDLKARSEQAAVFAAAITNDILR